MLNKGVCLFVLLLVTVHIFPQGVKPGAAKPAAAPVFMKNVRDSASYGVGIFIINQYRRQSITNFNSTFVSKAINDLQSGKKSLLTDEQANLSVLAYQAYLRTKKPGQVLKSNPRAVLKTLRDSASYSAGLYAVTLFRSLDIVNINTIFTAQAINDMQAGRKQRISDDRGDYALRTYQAGIQLNKSKPNIEAGEKFLADNKKRPEVKTTASGLQYEIITQGTGSVPVNGDSVTCNYIGRFIDGKEFENSYSSGRSVTFSVNGVIAGWTEALLMMPVGSKWKLYIPYQLGYGPGDYGTIPGGSALIFDLELLNKKPQ